MATFNNEGLGGAVLNSIALVIYFDAESGQGGAVLNGRAPLNFEPQASGGAVVNGKGLVAQDFAPVTADGGVTVESADSTADASFVWFQNTVFSWNLIANINQDFSFLWDTGELRILWYRLIGKGRDTQCPIVSDDVCCQKYIMNVHARTITELCEKIQARRWKWPIDSVEVFSRPARNEDIAEDEANGINHDCNVLTPVEICNIPECFSFCVDIDQQELIGFDMILIRQSFFSHEASGEVFITGAAITSFAAAGIADEEGSGGLVLGGEAEDSVSFLGPGHFIYNPSGNITIGGTIDLISSAYAFEADGNAIFILGSAGTSVSNIGTVGIQMGFDTQLRDVEVSFAEDVDEQNLVVLATSVTRCDCANISTTLDLGYNFVQSNVFAQFLVRNGLTIPSPINLRYNSVNDLWQANLHFRGFAPDADTLELWNMVFEVQCTNEIGSTVLGQNVWKVGVHILRRNLSTLEDFDTRILVALLPDTACSSGDLVFTVVYDTQTDFAFIQPDSTVYQNFIWDNIGMFRNDFWIDNPNLILQVTEIGIEGDQPRVNLDALLIPSNADLL